MRHIKQNRILPLALVGLILSCTYASTGKIEAIYSSWGIDSSHKEASIHLEDTLKKFKKKKNIVVAVIDTGIDPTHPFLSKNIYVHNGKVSNQNFGIDFSEPSVKASDPKTGHGVKPEDKHGHGTHVAGIIKSVFPEVKILALKYYDQSSTNEENLTASLKALRYAVEADVDIINYSGGGEEAVLEELRILKLAEEKGILVVAAAGNNKSDIDDKKKAYYPASYGLGNILTVTAHDTELDPLSSSNWGKNSVDISAPGYHIKSSVPAGHSEFMSGTSQATAFVSGVAALLKAQNPELKAKDLRAIIKNTATKVDKLASRTSSGGILNAKKAFEYAATTVQKKIRSIAYISK